MPPSKGPAERGHTLQAQEQGTGTMPHRAWQASPSGEKRRDWGEPWCWGTPPPRKRDTPSPWGRRLLRSDCGCYSAPDAEAESVGKAPAGLGSQDGTHGTEGHAPQQTHPRCRGGTTPGVSWREPPSATRAGNALDPASASSLFLGFKGRVFFARTVLYLLLPPRGWKLLSHQAPDLEVAAFFSPRCHFPGH